LTNEVGGQIIFWFCIIFSLGMKGFLLIFDDFDHLLTDLANPFIGLDLGHDLKANFTTDF